MTEQIIVVLDEHTYTVNTREIPTEWDEPNEWEAWLPNDPARGHGHSQIKAICNLLTQTNPTERT